MLEQNKEIVRKINRAFAEGNFEGFLAYCAEDVEWTIIGDRVVKGREAIRQWMRSMAKENPEPPKFTDADLVAAEGDIVVSRGDMTMKDKNGKTVPYSYCDIYRFRNGEIAELRSFVVNTEVQSKASSQAV
jgi:uncharacterized protein (TIGR02246 family)